MSNMQNVTYTVSMALAKSPHDVFNHLIELSKWWPEDYEGTDMQLNSEFVLKRGDSHYSKNRVIKFIPEQSFAWLTIRSNRESDGFDWTGTKMIFELAPKDNGTLLHFTYDGLGLENQFDSAVEICDLTVKEMF